MLDFNYLGLHFVIELHRTIGFKLFTYGWCTPKIVKWQPNNVVFSLADSQPQLARIFAQLHTHVANLCTLHFLPRSIITFKMILSCLTVTFILYEYILFCSYLNSRTTHSTCQLMFLSNFSNLIFPPTRCQTHILDTVHWVFWWT